jgi:hypothetical protein
LENISPVYARFVLRELTGRGIEASRVLAGTTLDRERLETGGDISVGDFVTILDNGRKLGDDERLGLMIGRHCNPLTLGPVGAAMANAPTVREGLQAMENYSRLHASYIGVTVQSNLEGLSIKIDFLQDLRDTERFHSESAVMMLQNYVETLTGRLLDDGPMYAQSCGLRLQIHFYRTAPALAGTQVALLPRGYVAASTTEVALLPRGYVAAITTGTVR